MSAIIPSPVKKTRARRVQSAVEQGSQPVRQVRITPPPQVDDKFWKRFKPVRLLGEGTSGRVWLVESLGKKFALKILKNGVDAETQNEIEALQYLSGECPQIIRYYGLFRIPDLTGEGYVDALLMEYVSGVELFDIEDESPEFSWFLLDELAPQLACIHEYGVLHRDIKLENIMMQIDEETGEFQRARLIDFGLACTQGKIASKVGRPCVFAPYVGTPLYMAPELWRALEADKPFVPTAALDMYALGVVLWQMLTGDEFLPVESYFSPRRVEKRIRQAQAMLNSGDPKLDAIVINLLSPNPEDRMTAEELDDLLMDHFD